MKLSVNILSVLALGVFLVLAVGTSGDDDSSSSSSSSASSGDSSGGDSGGGEAAEPAAPAGPEIGIAKTIGDFEVTLTATKEKTKVRNSPFKHKASEGATLRIVDVKVTNNGKDQAMIFSNFKLLDNQSREFDTSSECTMATKGHLSMEQINPGLGKSGSLCFEIPAAAAGLKLHFSSSMFGGKKGTFTLDK